MLLQGFQLFQFYSKRTKANILHSLRHRNLFKPFSSMAPQELARVFSWVVRFLALIVRCRLNKEVDALSTVPGLMTYTHGVSDHSNTAAWGGSASGTTVGLQRERSSPALPKPWGLAFLASQNVNNTIQPCQCSSVVENVNL